MMVVYPPVSGVAVGEETIATAGSVSRPNILSLEEVCLRLDSTGYHVSAYPVGQAYRDLRKRQAKSNG